MFTARQLSPPSFRFSSSDTEKVAIDKFRGLQRFGPYRDVPFAAKFAFVFPKQHREEANTLYRALRNGVGMFRGFANMFRMPLEREQVFQISDFVLRDYRTHHDSARAYADAILNWVSNHNITPDLLFVLHPKSPPWQEDTPYHVCKASLLNHGFISQNVTLELIHNGNQFEWSVANIALAAFVKLGGIPWVVHRRTDSQQLVIGVGRSDLFDPSTRTTERTVAFTTCLRTDGVFKFSTISNVAQSRIEYLDNLTTTVGEALDRIDSEKLAVETLSLHIPKEFSHEEDGAVRKAVLARDKQGQLRIHILKVTDEPSFFLVDEAAADGLPRRGTCVRIADRDYLLYTEGREEKQVWRNRLPTALRIRHYDEQVAPSVVTELVSQVFDLSQTNWRAFNALSRPVSILYSELIASLLSHGLIDRSKAKDVLTDRLWFL